MHDPVERPGAERRWPRPTPWDFFETTRLLRTGSGDPTVHRLSDGLWRTAHTAAGPATVRLRVADDVHAMAWGPGAEAVLDDVPDWIGLQEPPWTLPEHPVTDRLLAAHRGLRGTDTHDLFEAIVAQVLQQLVTWNEAAMTWRRLCERLGERAPGPVDMRLSPTPRALRRAGVARIQSAGVGRQRARALVEAASVAHAIRAAASMSTADAMTRLCAVPGIGVWTAAGALGMRANRPEPLLLGDYHLPNTVCWALAREARGTEARMLELLEPFEGYAFRVVRLIYAARINAPRFGPKRGWR